MFEKSSVSLVISLGKRGREAGKGGMGGKGERERGREGGREGGREEGRKGSTGSMRKRERREGMERVWEKG